MSDSTADTIREIAAEVARVDTLKLGLGDNMVEVLELDSAQVMELLAEVEERFDIEISEVEAAKLETLQHVVDFVEKAQGSSA